MKVGILVVLSMNGSYAYIFDIGVSILKCIFLDSAPKATNIHNCNEIWYVMGTVCNELQKLLTPRNDGWKF